MKDYYKILGVKENASEEEIRARWIELTKHYHPDLGKGNESEQKIKEINDAYQTLKFSSNRMEYDLKRNYEWKKRKVYIKRISPYGIIFVLLIIFCALFIGKLQVPSLRKLESVTYHLKGAPQSQSNPINQRDQIDQRNKVNKINQIDQIGWINQINQVAPQPKSETVVKEEKVVPKEVDKLVSKEVNKDASWEFVKEVPGIEHPVLPSGGEGTIFESERSVNIENLVPEEITKLVSQESLKIVPEEVPKVEEVKPSNPLIAREEEIRQFFVNYTDRYTRKDIDGFLSFFSFKAIQNQKGFDEIKKVYTIFFKESEELRYQLEDLKIENHQNNVEVTANYKVDQVLKKRGEKKVWKGRIRWILVRENDVLKILSLDYQHQRYT